MGLMSTSDGQIGRDEDAAPVDMLASLFEARGWPYEFAGDDEISGEVQGSWASYQLRGIWRAEDHVLQIICLPDIRVPDEKRAATLMFDHVMRSRERLHDVLKMSAGNAA